MNRLLTMRRRPPLSPIGAYKGMFRIDRSTGFLWHDSDYNCIAAHPSSSKLYGASYRSSAGRLYEINLPADLDSLEKDDVTASDIVSAVNEDSTIFDDFVTDSGLSAGNVRFGGLTYAPDADELWCSMARSYHVSPDLYNNLVEASTDGNFTRIGDLRGPFNPSYSGSISHPSDVAGKLSHTEGSGLSEKFISEAGWLSDHWGPRLTALTPKATPTDEYDWAQIAAHDESNKESSPAFKYLGGGGFFHNGHFWFLMRRGIGGGWYGYNNGYTSVNEETGTLGTRNSDTSGILTGISGHDFVASETPVTLQWTGSNERVGVTVDSVTADSVTFSGGTGDVLPAESTTGIILAHWGADPLNSLPDEVDQSKGYHDPPYAPFLYSCRVTKMQDSLDTTINVYDIPWQHDDTTIADVMVEYINGQPRARLVNMIKHAGHVFVAEEIVDDGQAGLTSLMIVHVWALAA